MKVYIFTEAGAKSGYGHLTRCRALGDELTKRGAETEYIIAGEPVMISREQHRDWTRFNDFDFVKNSYCIVDSYLASQDIVREICLSSKRCLCIDDNNIRNYTNCLVVNPAAYSEGMEYSGDSSVKFLLGREYVILREAFRAKFKRDVRREICEITITLGGTDVLGLVPGLLRSLIGTEIKKNVVVSRDAEYLNELSDYNAKVYTGLNDKEMRDLFLKSDLVISGGGQTVNELVQCRTPGVFICVAENQQRNLAFAINNGFGLEISSHEAIEKIAEVIKKMDYSARLDAVNHMDKFDFSCGVENIINEFT